MNHRNNWNQPTQYNQQPYPPQPQQQVKVGYPKEVSRYIWFAVITLSLIVPMFFSLSASMVLMYFFIGVLLVPAVWLMSYVTAVLVWFFMLRRSRFKVLKVVSLILSLTCVTWYITLLNMKIFDGRTLFEFYSNFLW